MKFSDEGIIIDVRKYGEKSLILKIFSKQHGIYSGFVKYAKSSKTAAIYHVGNLVSFEFHSRLEDSLGSFAAIDLVKSYCSQIIFDQIRLNAANSLFLLFNEFFLERENHENIFEKLHEFLCALIDERNSHKDVIANYIKLELAILEALGYGINLTCCVVTGSTVDLAYVSPKSACAVSANAAKNYENKLLKLPVFLLEEKSSLSSTHLLDGLKLSGFFIEKFLLENDKTEKLLHRKNIAKNISKLSD